MTCTKLSLYSIIVCSRCFLSPPSICDPSHWNISRNFFLDSASLVGSSCSRSMSSRISFSMRRCIGVCSVSFPGFYGVGNQKLSSLDSCSLDFMSSLTYICVSSGSFNSDSAAVSMGRICLVSSGLSI